MSDTLVLNGNGQPLSYIPLSVVSWQVALRLLFTDKVTVLKEYDNWTVRSQYIEVKVPSVVIMTEQVKWKRNIKYNRMNVYLRDNLTCQLQIDRKCKARGGKVGLAELTLDHVVPRSHGGKTSWVNVCTSCKDCNSMKGSDKSIVPKKKPYKPDYYEILNRRKALPMYIREEAWKAYIDWPEELFRITPSNFQNDIDRHYD